MALHGGLLTYADPGREKGGPRGEMGEEGKEKRGRKRQREGERYTKIL